MLVVVCAQTAVAEDWANMPYTPHSTYQSVNANGASAYSSGFPVAHARVVLANTEDWLDPTPDNQHLSALCDGGQAELIVRVVDPGDFGGTFCWMGPELRQPAFQRRSRLQLYRRAVDRRVGASGFVRRRWRNSADPGGDLVEVRARMGLFYGGKMNINEAHNNTPVNDFEVVLLQANYGVPAPAALSLSDLKDASNQFIFDATRATGAEPLSGDAVELQNVRFTADSIANWGINKDLVLEDQSGRTLGIPSRASIPASAARQRSPAFSTWWHSRSG